MPPLVHRTVVMAICSGGLLLSGCADYGITVNEQQVYKPRPALVMDQITDPKLAGCIEQTAADQRISRAEQLRQLVCTNAGIEDLAGLEQFSKLKRLDLSHNALTRIDTVYELSELEYLRLEGNPNLSCADVKTLQALPGEKLKIEAPEHCQ